MGHSLYQCGWVILCISVDGSFFVSVWMDHSLYQCGWVILCSIVDRSFFVAAWMGRGSHKPRV